MIFHPHVPEGVKADILTSNDGKSIDLFIEEIPILSICIGENFCKSGNIHRLPLHEDEKNKLESMGFKIEGSGDTYRVANLEVH